MPLETATFINDLTITNPTSADPKSQGDDHIRLVKSAVKNSLPGFTGVILGAGTETQGASVNEFVVTLSPAPAAYTANTILAFKATHTNTAACTLQIGALGTKPFLAVDGSALSSGDITTGEFVTAIYDGTSFFLLSGNDRAARDGETYAGTHNMTGAVLTVAAPGANANAPYRKTDIDAAFLLYAPLASPVFTGNPQGPTPAPGDNDASLATTAFVVLSFAPKASPVFTGTPSGPTAPPGTVSSQFATMAALAAAGITPAVLADTFSYQSNAGAL
jgi:hypothetical protein